MEFLKKITFEKSLKKPRNNIGLIGLREAKSIGFVCKDSSSPIIQQWKTGLEKAGKKVQECVFIDKKLKKGEEPPLEFVGVFKNHISMNGIVKSERGKVFKGRKFDILVTFGKDLTTDQRIFIAQSSAKLKIGLHSKENEQIQDFLINLNGKYDDESYIVAIEKNLKLFT